MSFRYPKIYNFPPFFTKQPNEQTWRAQLSSWIQLILDYSKENKIWIMNNRGKVLSKGTIEDYEADEDAGDAGEDDEAIEESSLFVNKQIDRSLGVELINEIFSEMVKNNDASYLHKGDSTTIVVNWYRPEDWASMILEWCEETGQLGSVLTMYEISNGDISIGAEFHGIHPVVLEKALNVLVKRGRAGLIKDGGKIQGVKIE